MIEPAIPHDEEARVKALEDTGVLDTPAEERFDRYTRLTRRLFDVPIALVSLVDRERQWFKSKQGLDACETSRDISFCGHAILGDEVFVVGNALNDERFSDNPLVVNDPSIRFYAGCPLTSPDGYRLGTLCIIDREPRELADKDLDALQDIATMVSNELAALRLATIDELTGLSNRRAFNMIADQSLHMCSRSNRSASLLMLDLDGFKQINDELGHAAGDKALVEFAHTLRSSFRDSDVVARLGGDEFCVLLTDTDLEHAWCSVERFRDALDVKNDLPGRKYRLMFSAGVIQRDPDRHQTVADLLNDADILMYERKRAKPLPKSVDAIIAS
ncbi:MAG: sensor domain-containing diguanylate cyclase [Gammaproteobacteria bacterium]|nr:sensor domain-containing diguanylate cyclase [Gammaproteobacteria bacterium]NNF61176.1 sensor domain-containing diguanylate cyclase [Gammaproteobacteria bacterium]NNM19871.1 sensor domain-containing diguanylate cyclase [Gammaproteobacteria bacterium]